MKKVLGRIKSFLLWLNAWCVGHVFYKGKYLHGKFFPRFRYSRGWQWVMHDFFMQKIVGINRDVPFPVSFNVTVIKWKRIEFDLDNMNMFQKQGNYYQAAGGGRLIIGKNCYIASNVGMVTANHDPAELSAHQRGKDVVIGEECWIGMNAVILPGVVLGPHTTVGAGSVVTKSFPEGYCVIAGNPARKLRDIDMEKQPNVGTRDCTGCMLCVHKCPAGAITIERKNGFDRPTVDPGKCIKCGLCNLVCPVNEPKKDDLPSPIVALCDKDEANRAESSSGGAVGLFAAEIFRRGGVVSGVVMDENLHAVHRITRTPEEFRAIHGSKYLQAQTVGEGFDVFAELETELKTGKPVLATGTPCQIAAVKKCFGDKYPNLFTCDVICHGVQSPAVFEGYIADLEQKTGKKVAGFDFRCKRDGWKDYRYRAVFADGSEKLMPRRECDYFRYCNHLRTSCHRCHFRDFNNYSDVTVGDYWGVETLTDAFNDDKGCSIALCHTDKGRELLEAVKPYAVTVESNADHAIRTHKKLVSSQPEPPSRDEFFGILDKQGYAAAEKFFAKKTRAYEFKRKIKKIFKK